ncbi:MAG: metal-dependent hydrolase [Anaerolineales bacterium]|nr:metal-dependent hydrolase [Anaerolineales bacterium]MCB8990061.1 metal-dependent hydrolase [Ardenticatenaceae bacterium]MCB9005628.1 metal-dependent hydrolase [Ardenticatenaceae bacterium]
MAQAGIHGMVGTAVRKWAPAREWLVLGIILGNLFPDADNLAVAVATVMGKSTEGLHRTFTHSLFTVVAIIIVFQIVAALSKRPRWGNLGWGLGIGVLMHILLDFVIWFNGVEILWPIPSWVNFWEGVTPPEWFSKLMMPVEMLFFALYFWMLYVLARKQGTDLRRLKGLKVWTAVQSILFLLFLVLVYTMQNGFMTIYGAVYLLSLGLGFVITIQMRQTIEAGA